MKNGVNSRKERSRGEERRKRELAPMNHRYAHTQRQVA